MVKAIFFDLWGTLVENGSFPSPVKQIWRLMPERLSFQDFIVKFENSLMTQEFENLIAAFTKVLKDFGSKDKDLVEKMVGVWNRNALFSRLFPDAKVLTDLKKKYKIVLLSNSTSEARNVIEKFKIEDCFDLIFISCEQGKLKADLFKEALKKLKLKPEDAVMVGDSTHTDMEGAEKVGIKGILLDRRNKREYEHKIVSLNDLESVL
jgi:putative hydrolase of the HAD superfamily